MKTIITPCIDMGEFLQHNVGIKNAESIVYLYLLVQSSKTDESKPHCLGGGHRKVVTLF